MPDQPGSRAGIPNATDAEIEAALMHWAQSGSSRKAAKASGWDDTTIRRWRERHPDVWRKVSHACEEALSAQRIRLATDVAEGLLTGAAEIRRRLEAPESLDARELAALTKTLADIDGTQDRIRRLDAGTPTEISEQQTADVDALLADQAERHARIRAYIAAHPQLVESA